MINIDLKLRQTGAVARSSRVDLSYNLTTDNEYIGSKIIIEYTFSQLDT